jgi:hypothetical protein
MRRPALTIGDAEAIERLAPSVRSGRHHARPRVSNRQPERAFYRGERTATNQILGVSTDYATISFMKLQLGRFFTEPEVSHRRRVVVLGDGPYQVLFGSKGIDPINKRIRLGAIEYTVIGIMDKRPSLGSLDTGRTISPSSPTRRTRSSSTSTPRGHCAAATPSAASSASCRATTHQGSGLAEVEEIMRVRHGSSWTNRTTSTSSRRTRC